MYKHNKTVLQHWKEAAIIWDDLLLENIFLKSYILAIKHAILVTKCTIFGDEAKKSCFLGDETDHAMITQ